MLHTRLLAGFLLGFDAARNPLGFIGRNYSLRLNGCNQAIALIDLRRYQSIGVECFGTYTRGRGLHKNQLLSLHPRDRDFLALSCAAFAASPIPCAVPSDARLQKAYRFQHGGWTYVHLEGTPADIGFQHGYLLAPEISDALEAIKLFDTHQTQRDWEFFRTTARQMLWPHIDVEYQQELQGIADGVKTHGVNLRRLRHRRAKRPRRAA